MVASGAAGGEPTWMSSRGGFMATSGTLSSTSCSAAGRLVCRLGCPNAHAAFQMLHLCCLSGGECVGLKLSRPHQEHRDSVASQEETGRKAGAKARACPPPAQCSACSSRSQPSCEKCGCLPCPYGLFPPGRQLSRCACAAEGLLVTPPTHPLKGTHHIKKGSLQVEEPAAGLAAQPLLHGLWSQGRGMHSSCAVAAVLMRGF